jgi:hypothetical protein
VSGNPVIPMPIWQANLLHAQAAPRCGARNRAGKSCQSPAMSNGRCRLHGGLSTGAPHGAGNGMWKHGRRSIEVIERRRAMTAEMRKIRRVMRELART